MRRLTLMTLLLTLAPATAASAKEVSAMDVCGREGCVRLDRTAAQSFHDDGSLWGAMLERNPGAVRWYRVTMFFGDGSGETLGRVRSAYAPGLRAMSMDAEPATPWQRVSAKGAAVLDRAAARLTPFGARRFGPPDAPAPEPAPATAEPEDDDGFPLLAGVPAAALLLGGLGLIVARRC
jgi:hypothetical protein